MYQKIILYLNDDAYAWIFSEKCIWLEDVEQHKQPSRQKNCVKFYVSSWIFCLSKIAGSSSSTSIQHVI